MIDPEKTIGDLINKVGVSFIGSIDSQGFPNMKVLEDIDSKELILNEGDTIYYPLGVTNPDYCVLKFTAYNGRFYSNFKSEDFQVE